MNGSNMKVILSICVALLAGTGFAAEENWRPLWDGKTLNGWHQIGQGTWKIEDDAIHGVHLKNHRDYGHLATDRNYTNFVIRLKYKAIKGNSGLYFRTEEKGSSGVSGFQAEIDPEKDAGGLYETNGRSWVVQPKASDVKRWYKPGEWNEMIVSAIGNHLIVHVNGMKSSEVPNDTKGRKFGEFALQLHGGQDVDVWFTDIEIQEK
jgi:hypothetical protein